LVNDDGIGLVIPCPNCARDIAIPRETDAEFQGQVLAIAPAPLGAGALRPQLARLMMDQLFQAIYHQRRQLLETQQTGTAQIVLMEQRLAAIQQEHQSQLRAHEQRIVELQGQLMQREEENRQLIREKFLLAKEALDRQLEGQTEDEDYVLRA
jgi:hypothetical protein